MRGWGWLLALALALPGAASEPGWLQRQVDAASPGAVVRVPAGVHQGPLVINGPIQLLGEPGATIEGSGRGHVIEIRASDVVVQGLLLRRSGSSLSNDDAGIHVTAHRAIIRGNIIVDTLHGIYVRGAGAARIEDNVIRGRASAAAIDDPVANGLKLAQDELCSVTLEQDQRGNGIHIWNSSGHEISRNDIRNTRDGIYFSFCDDSVVRGNLIREVRYGLHYMYSDNNTFEENVFQRNAAGSALMYSNGIVLRRNRFEANRSHRAYGLLMHTVEQTHIEENRMEGNTIGIFLEGCIATTLRSNTVSGNYIGIRLSDSSDSNRFSGNTLRANIHSVETGGLNTSNRWAVDGVGNFWDSALKLDLDADGIADVPHQETDLFGRWRHDFPEIGLLSGSPGERALRFVHTRVRIPGIPGVSDPRPLARAPTP